MSTILIPACLAGLVAIAVTVAIERFGGLIGGILGTLPTTIVPAAYGLWFSLDSDHAFRDALAITPVGMLLDAGFLFLWRELPSRLPSWSLHTRLTAMSVLTLTAWFIGAALSVVATERLDRMGIPPVWVGSLATTVMILWGIWACLAPIPAPKGTNRVGPVMLGLRGLFAALAIAICVWIGTLGQGLIAGMAAVFPAIFFTSMAGLWLSQGEAVPGGAVGPMMLGASSVSAFSLLVGQLAPAIGLISGFTVAWFASILLTSVPAAIWLRARRTSQNLKAQP